MLDVHPPHEPVHGLRDFMLHLLTITIGLLIALGLEGLVEWRHHQNLRHEAATNIRKEMAVNRKELTELLAAIPGEQSSLTGMLANLQDRQAGRPMQGERRRLNMKIAGLQDASWQTANATGALAYMEFDEVQQYAAAYQLQKQLDGLQNSAVDNVVGLQALLATADPEKMNTADAASAVNIDRSLMAHIETLRELAVSLNQTYSTTLDAKGND